MRSWHLLNMALLKVEKGHFETAILITHNFSSFITVQVFETLCTMMQLFKGSYFSVDAASRHF